MFKNVQIIDSSFSPRHRQGSHSASCSKSLHRTDNDPQSKGAKGCLERCFTAELNCVALGVCSLPDMNHVCRSVTHDEIETFPKICMCCLTIPTLRSRHHRISMNFYLSPPKKSSSNITNLNQSASKARRLIVPGFVPRHPTHHGGVKAMAHPRPTTRSSKWPQCIWVATFSFMGTKCTKTMGDLIEMSCRSCAQLLRCQSWNRISLHFTNQRLQTNRLLDASKWHKTWSLIAKW